jgi:hypothetical protein
MHRPLSVTLPKHTLRHRGLPIAAALLGLTAALAVPVAAAPVTPLHDDEVVERLPRGAAARRAERAALARGGLTLPEALAGARAALQRARLEGDPRELGAAQALLAPWWAAADAPPAVRLLRATLRQSQHQFEPALDELQALWEAPATPLDIRAQAGLTRATVLQVLGRFEPARALCDALQQPPFAPLGADLALTARACSAEVRSLTADPRAAAAELQALAAARPADPWLALVRAELAERRGQHGAAEVLFRQASAGGGVYALAAHADWLLDRGRPGEVLALIAAGPPDADALLLRRAIALHRMQNPAAAAATAQLQARFDAARQRGESLHAREEARLALDVRDDAPRALALARAQWALQKEPADAVLLWRAARAAAQPAAAAGLRGWVADPAGADVRLAGWTAASR